MEPSIYALLATAVLALHVGVAVFVVGGLVAVLVGHAAGWRWVDRMWFRAVHVTAIAVIVSETWLGVVCPLTTLEMWLRERAGRTTYGGGFIEHWLAGLLYYEAPPWVFVAAYSIFGVLVVATWRRFPPRRQAHVDGRAA